MANAIHNYTSVEFHINGEQSSIEGKSESKRFLHAFPSTIGAFNVLDGTDMIISDYGNSFAYLKYDAKAEKGLGEKEQCNNYGDCVHKKNDADQGVDQGAK